MSCIVAAIIICPKVSSIRRYFITRFVQESKNRDLTRQIVGHSSTRMTDYYVGNMIDEETKTTISLGL